MSRKPTIGQETKLFITTLLVERRTEKKEENCMNLKIFTLMTQPPVFTSPENLESDVC